MTPLVLVFSASFRAASRSFGEPIASSSASPTRSVIILRVSGIILVFEIRAPVCQDVFRVFFERGPLVVRVPGDFADNPILAPCGEPLRINHPRCPALIVPGPGLWSGHKQIIEEILVVALRSVMQSGLARLLVPGVHELLVCAICDELGDFGLAMGHREVKLRHGRAFLPKHFSADRE